MRVVLLVLAALYSEKNIAGVLDYVVFFVIDLARYFAGHRQK